MTTEPNVTIPQELTIIPRARVLRWAERVEAAIDNEPERVDVLLDLSEDLEHALDQSPPDAFAAWAS